jgi:hypothetical protein
VAVVTSHGFKPLVTMQLTDAEALRIGPDDVLLVKLGPGVTETERDQWADALATILPGRCMLAVGDVEFAVVSRPREPVHSGDTRSQEET